ncbi:hypothetical protein ACHQM5_015386 [Ranunculus cassubicifolius]
MISDPTNKVISAAASVAAVAMLVGNLANLLPNELKEDIYCNMRLFVNRITSRQLTLVISEFDGLINNEVYEAAEIYLGGKINSTSRKLRLSKPRREKNVKVTMEKDEVFDDVFDGAKFRWRKECYKQEKNVVHSSSSSGRFSEVRYFQLSFHKKEKDKFFKSYLPYVLEKAKSVAAEKKTLKLFTVDHDGLYESLGNAWNSVFLEHPSTFDTLALDPKLKKTILDDLDGFVNRKEFYKSVGKAWKRGYLLYGPPGTGKSSLIAAIANYLNFDVYDLDLTEIHQNSELRKLLVATANRSILVVEDIDCNINFQDREAESQRKNSNQTVTLSGMLNFIDGLWSTCGDERIIIFTTNHKDKLDPALLRPGRMDMHIKLSYCTPSGFKVLAYNYLMIRHHPLFKDIRKMIKKVDVTPADIAEKLMKNAKPDIVLQELLEFLEIKRNQQGEGNVSNGPDEEEDVSDEEEDGIIDGGEQEKI